MELYLKITKSTCYAAQKCSQQSRARLRLGKYGTRPEKAKGPQKFDALHCGASLRTHVVAQGPCHEQPLRLQLHGHQLHGAWASRWRTTALGMYIHRLIYQQASRSGTRCHCVLRVRRRCNHRWEKGGHLRQARPQQFVARERKVYYVCHHCNKGNMR